MGLFGWEKDEAAQLAGGAQGRVDRPDQLLSGDFRVTTRRGQY